MEETAWQQMSQLFTYTHACMWCRCLQQHILMNVQQMQHTTLQKHTKHFNKQGDLMLHKHGKGKQTFLCHRTVTTVEHKFHSCLHCSNTLGHTNSYLYVRILPVFMVWTHAKLPLLSPWLWFGFCELLRVFLYCRFFFSLNPRSTCWVSKV